MKRQICTTLTGAVFASFLLVLPQITSAAEEAEESASTQTGAIPPAIEQPGEGMILEDKDNGKIVILEDPTADEITVERTSIVTPGEDGEVEVRNVLVVSLQFYFERNEAEARPDGSRTRRQCRSDFEYRT